MPAASVQFTGFVPARDAERATSERPGFFARMLRAIQETQTRRAEREIAQFIERRGGRMTDDLERRIEKHFV